MATPMLLLDGSLGAASTGAATARDATGVDDTIGAVRANSCERDAQPARRAAIVALREIILFCLYNHLVPKYPSATCNRRPGGFVYCSCWGTNHGSWQLL